MVIINDKEDFESIISESKDVSSSDLKRKDKFSSFGFHGNPKRLISFVKRELEDAGYDVKQDKLDTKQGGLGDNVSDVSIKVYAEKRQDIKGKVKKIISRKIINLVILGIVLLIFGYIVIKYFNFTKIGTIGIISGIILIVFGFFFIFKGPKQKIFSYYPSSNIIWFLAEGEAFFGSKIQEASGKSEKGGSTKTIKTSYLTSEMDVFIASETKSLNELYREKLLSDKEKLNPSLFLLIKSLIRKDKEITMENEEEYNSLHENKEEKKKHTSKELENIAKKLSKFTGVD